MKRKGICIRVKHITEFSFLTFNLFNSLSKTSLGKSHKSSFWESFPYIWTYIGFPHASSFLHCSKLLVLYPCCTFQYSHKSCFHVNWSRNTLNNGGSGFAYSVSHGAMLPSFNSVIVCRFQIGLCGNLSLPRLNRGSKAWYSLRYLSKLQKTKQNKNHGHAQICRNWLWKREMKTRCSCLGPQPWALL